MRFLTHRQCRWFAEARFLVWPFFGSIKVDLGRATTTETVVEHSGGLKPLVVCCENGGDLTNAGRVRHR
jgi:hypothetical protein